MKTVRELRLFVLFVIKFETFAKTMSENQTPLQFFILGKYKCNTSDRHQSTYDTAQRDMLVENEIA